MWKDKVVRYASYFRTGSGESYTCRLDRASAEELIERTNGMTDTAYADQDGNVVLCSEIEQPTANKAFQHEIVHVICNHIARGCAIQGVEWEAWNICCDHVVTVFCKKYLDIPDMIGIELEGMPEGPVEKVYRLYMKKKQKQKDGQGSGNPQSGSGNPQPGSGSRYSRGGGNPLPTKPTTWFEKPDNPEEAKMKPTGTDIQSMVNRLRASGKLAGKEAGGMLREFEFARGVVFDWKKYLRRFSEQVLAGYDDIEISEPDVVYQRYLSKMYIPDDVSYKPARVGVIFDSSGSILGDTANKFISILNLGFKRYKVNARVIVIDTKIHYDKVVEKIDDFELRGGGGTDLRPAFDLLIKDKEVDTIFCLTDGYTPWPEKCRKRTFVVVEEGQHAAKMPGWGKVVLVD